VGKKNTILLLCTVLFLLGGIISTNLFSDSKEKESVKEIQKVNKFPSGSDVITAELHEMNVGPQKGTILYFDMDLPEQRETVTNILNWLNEDNVQLSEGELQPFYGYGGYNPTFIKLKFKDGRTYDIMTDEQNVVINGYYKDKSLIVSNCTALVQFINAGWESSKQKMTLMFYEISEVLAAEIRPAVGKRMIKPGESSFYVFDLSKTEQRDTVGNILNWLNSINNTTSQITERLDPPKGGCLNTILQIDSLNGKRIIIYVDELEKKIIINGQYLNKSIVVPQNDCPQLVQFLNSDWEKTKKDMIKKTY
jgi:hypothetical protein